MSKYIVPALRQAHERRARVLDVVVRCIESRQQLQSMTALTPTFVRYRRFTKLETRMACCSQYGTRALTTLPLMRS